MFAQAPTAIVNESLIRSEVCLIPQLGTLASVLKTGTESNVRVLRKKTIFISTGKSVIMKKISKKLWKKNYQVTFSQIPFHSNINEIYENISKVIPIEI
jgi:hypothetical protein